MEPATKVIFFFFRSFAIQAIWIILLWSFCNPLMGQAAISINEFMASNARTIADEDGDFEDWVELYNYGEDPVSLAGWGLSDHFSLPFQWVFPDTILQPGRFLLVWASGKDRTENTLHTSFSISASGESLLLTHPSGNCIEFISTVAVPTDVSFGRQPDGTGDWYFFDEPTPGGANEGEAFEGITHPPIFSNTGGVYEEDFTLSLSHSDPTVTIIYTTDGSDPDPDNLTGKTYFYKNQYAFYPDSADGEFLEDQFFSHVYASPLEIKDRTAIDDKLTHKATTVHPPNYFPRVPVFKGTVIRARAYREGFLPGKTVSHTYFVTPEGRDRIPLPIISIALQEDYLFDYEKGIYTPGVDADDWRAEFPRLNFTWPFPGNFHRRGPEHEFTANMEFIPEGKSYAGLNQRLGIRLHGGGTRSFPMKSLRLYARNSYGESELEYPFFKGSASGGFKRLILRNSGQDFTTNYWGSGTTPRTMFRDAMSQALVSHLQFDTQLYEPAIVFLNGEYWGLHNIREKYDKHYLERVYALHPDSIDLLTERDTPVEGDNLHYKATLEYIQTHGLHEEEHYQYILTRIDENSFMDYQVANIYLRNTDWPGNNIDFWRKRTNGYEEDAPYGHDGRWRWMMYDTDFGFGLIDEPHSYKHNTLEFAAMPDGQHWPNPAWSTLLLRSFLENEQFRTGFITRFADLLNTCFQSGHVLGIISEMKNRLEPAMEEHFQRWATWENMETWNSSVAVMEEFAIYRPYQMRQHLLSFFDLEAFVNVKVDVTHPLHGHVKVNTIAIHSDTPGVEENPFPWHGLYFKGVPVEFIAIPAKGYRFSHWEGGYTGTDSILVVNPDSNFTVTAHFVTTGEELLVHYWQFNDQLPNNIPLVEIPVHYTLSEGAWFTFESCLPEYPYYPGHQLWRQGSMERRNSPTPLNYRLDGNNNLPYDASTMRGIQIKQPLAWGDKMSSLVLHLSTAGIENPVLRFAAKDEGAAKGLLIDYSTTEEVNWQSLRSSYSFPLSNQYQLVEFDLSNLEDADDNPHLKVRIRFDSDNPWAQDGKRIVFNNFSLDGEVCMAYSLNSVAEDNGHIFPSGTMNISACSRKEFLIVPDPNHRIENVWLDGVSVIDEVQMAEDYSGTFIFDNPYQDHKLRASFELNSDMHDWENPVVLYPNPALDNLYIASEDEIRLIQVYDLSGRLLYEYDQTCRKHKMNTSVLNNGMYLVRIYTITGTYTRKVQVVRPVF